MSDEQDRKPIFRRPEQSQPLPVDDQAAYFAYWELQRQERARQQRVNLGDLSVYERSRLP